MYFIWFSCLQCNTNHPSILGAQLLWDLSSLWTEKRIKSTTCKAHRFGRHEKCEHPNLSPSPLLCFFMFFLLFRSFLCLSACYSLFLSCVCYLFSPPPLCLFTFSYFFFVCFRFLNIGFCWNAYVVVVLVLIFCSNVVLLVFGFFLSCPQVVGNIFSWTKFLPAEK